MARTIEVQVDQVGPSTSEGRARDHRVLIDRPRQMASRICVLLLVSSNSTAEFGLQERNGSTDRCHKFGEIDG